MTRQNDESKRSPASACTRGLCRIYVWCLPAEGWGANDVVGFAMAEDGEVLAQHISSNELFARLDMGVTSERKHDRYREKYPDGYELVWVDEAARESDEGFRRAFALNQAQAA